MLFDQIEGDVMENVVSIKITLDGADIVRADIPMNEDAAILIGWEFTLKGKSFEMKRADADLVGEFPGPIVVPKGGWGK